MNSLRQEPVEGVQRSLPTDWQDVYALTHNLWNEDALGVCVCVRREGRGEGQSRS